MERTEKSNKKFVWRVSLMVVGVAVVILVINLASANNRSSSKSFTASFVEVIPTSNIVPAYVEPTVTPRVPPTVAASTPTFATMTPVIVPSATPTLPPLPTATPLSRLAIFGAGTTLRGDLKELRPSDVTRRFLAGQEVFAYVNFAEGQPEFDRLELALFADGVRRKAQVYPIAQANGFLIVPLGKLEAGNYKLEIRYNNNLHALQPEFKVLAPPRRVYALGDSVMLGASNELYRLIPNIEVNALGSRQVAAGLEVLRSVKSAGRLGDAVVVHLGTNGAFTAQQFDEMMRILDGVPQVVFLNVKVPRGWTAPNNRIIAEGVARHPNAVLLDWSTVGEYNPQYFAGDGLHLTGVGARAYAEQIYGKLLVNG
jgi:hypothetical protein